MIKSAHFAFKKSLRNLTAGVIICLLGHTNQSAVGSDLPDEKNVELLKQGKVDMLSLACLPSGNTRYKNEV